MLPKPSLRIMLVESHVADVAIAVLVVRSIASGVRVLGLPFAHAIAFAITAAAIRDIPYFTFALNGQDRIDLAKLLGYLASCLIAAASAWALSRSIYKVGPVSSLKQCFITLRRSSHV